MNTQPKKRLQTARADALKMVIWANANKALIDNKKYDEIVAAFRKAFNGVVVTEGVVDEVLEAVGVKVNRAVRTPGKKSHYASDRLRFVCATVLKLTNGINALASRIGLTQEEYESLGLPTADDQAILNQIRQGRQYSESEPTAEQS